MLHHKLLEEQLKKFFPGGKKPGTELQNFINAVNKTYFSLEKEKELLLRRVISKGAATSHLNDRQVKEALRRSEEKYRNIIEKSTDIIYKTNNLGIFTFVNPVAQRITGYSEIELLDTHFSELIRPDYRKDVKTNYRFQIQDQKSTTYLEFPIVTKEGKERWIGQSVQYTKLEDNDYEMTALAIDITDRKMTEKILLLQEAKYRNIIANINMGLVEVDTNEVICYCNHGFTLLSGYSVEELVGKNIVDLLVQEPSRRVLKNKTAQRTNGLSDIYEIQIKNKRGEIRWWMISGAPNYDDAGNLTGSIGIHLDITERKLLEEELNISKQKAEESSKAKEAFLTNMSHEIRTPLNAIIGMIRELSYENLSEKQKVYVRNTSTASQHLLSVLNNILDMSKIEAGELQLEAQPLNLEGILNNTVNILQNSAAEKSLFLNASVSKEIKSNLLGDSTRVRQIILNLVGNAIKFTEKGGVSIECDLEKETAGSQSLLISISDTGIGMGEDYIKNVFTKFSQEDVSTARNYGGTGLGMAITRELIQLMHGSIDVKSKRHNGTTITLRLTLPLAENLIVNTENNAGAKFNLSPLKVLLTEDNEFNRLVATKTLERNTCIVTAAVNGADAVKKLKSESFDVILMDLQMPVLDGIEATRIIRNMLNLDTPIIALSANAFKTESDQCFKEGMNDYVTKPFEEKTLMDCIHKHTGSRVRVESRQPEKKAVPEKLYNMEELNALSGGDNAYIIKLVEIFIRQTGNSLKQLKTALAAKDLKTVFQLSHQMKPSIDGFKIESLKLEVREIEKDAKEGKYSNRLEKLVAYTDEILTKVMDELKKEFNTEEERALYEYQP